MLAAYIDAYRHGDYLSSFRRTRFQNSFMALFQKEEKERFFRDLYHLDTLVSEVEEQPIQQPSQGLDQSLKRKRSPCRASVDTGRASRASHSNHPAFITRAMTMAEKSHQANAAPMRRTKSDRQPPKLSRASSTRGGKSLRLLPENERFFRDCVICKSPFVALNPDRPDSRRLYPER